jgi:hypothetical protein
MQGFAAHRLHYATSQIFFAERSKSANARCARNSARLRPAVCSFPHVPKMYVYFLVTFFIVSVLIAGMASKQGTINFGQKRKAPEPDNLFVNNVSVPRRGRATPPSQASLSLFAILSLLLYLFLPHSFFYAPPKNIAPFFWLPIFFPPIFLEVPNSSCDIMSHKATLGATSSRKMRPPVAMRH